MVMDYLQFIFQAINNLLTQNLGFFDAMGQHLFRLLATILVAWYGVKSALAAAGGRQPFHFDNFATLLLTISFGFGMINYYDTPLPGVGTSFHNVVTDESQFLANKINQTELQTVVERVNDFETRMDAPGVTDLLGTILYTVVIILLASAQAVAIVVIAFGFIATAVCVLLGPVFIPFFIVPKLEWLFWGWFRCFVQYAFYQVIAAAVVFVIGNLIMGILGLQPQGAISTVQLIEEFPVLLITFGASIYALLKVPALTNHIFSGTAGGSSAAILGSLVPCTRQVWAAEGNLGKRKPKETTMAFIKKPPVNVERTLQLEKPVSELLDEYCRFVDCTADYVANFALRKMLARDPEYRKWKVSQDGSKGNATKSQSAAGKA
jgi:TrbL/VirB6 plasmid conjugal transfer protein